MKLLATIIGIILVAICPLYASLYSYPKDKRPAVSLAQADAIARKMLKSRSFDKEYYAVTVSLYGDEEGSGWGAWNIWCYNDKGDLAATYIPFPTGKCTMTLYPGGRSSSDGKDEKIIFDTAEKMKAEQGVAPQSATRSESDSEGGDKPQPESEARSR